MKCRFCGCTDDKACTYTIAGVVCACYWIDVDVCSAPAKGSYSRKLKGGDAHVAH
jgi:hypothetical protein